VAVVLQRPRIVTTSLRRLSLWLLLSLLLVIAQQGAVAHEISHYADDVSQSQQKNKQSPADKFCEKCLAFAQIAGSVNTELPVLPLLLLTYDHTPQAPAAFIAADAPAYRSRDPPSLL
jgi:hypothetical protein